MADYEYEEENLDEFMINASSILSEEDNPDRETIIESLKQHLSSISNEQSEMQNFYKTLNQVIIDKKTKKIIHKQAFKLYPIIFSLNPNSSFYYIDYFLFIINECISEENREDFSYISNIFSEVVLSFFGGDLSDKNLALDNNKKYKLYEKLLNFCNEKIKTNKRTEQSFGCLLLTELIEKCPIVTEEKYLDNLFKLISNYLDDALFVCKLDLLNCTISLIFTTESKFKPYANICLFRVLDYLTDEEWMKRKLAINIVYALVFYCKDEIMAVKENIVEFLNTLKEDSVEEVREVCLQTLKFIEENETIGADKKEIKNEKENKNNEDNKSPNINENSNDNIINKNMNMEIKDNENINNNIDLNSSENKIINKKNENASKKNNKKIIKKEKKIINSKSKNISSARSKSQINYNNETKNENEETKNDDKNEINNYRMNNKYNRLIMKQKANEEYVKKQLLKEKYYLEKKEKELNEKTKNYNIINNNSQQKPKSNKPKKKQNKTIAKLIKDFSIPDSMNKEDSLKIEDKNEDENKELTDSNINKNNNENTNDPKNDEQFKSTLNEICNQLNEIQKEQSQFLSMLNNLQNSINDNYSNLNKRILVLEEHYKISSKEE